MNYMDQDGAKTPKSSISLLSRESKNKVNERRENVNVQRGQEIKLDLLQLALNNCESSIGPKKWMIDEKTKTEKFQNFQRVLANREK